MPLRICMFYHSLLSDWNHGNAHFLRGLATELISRGHDVRVYEPQDAWSYRNLLQDQGIDPLRRFAQVYPQLTSRRYNLDSLDLAAELDKADLVIVHEWNDPDVVARIGRFCRSRPNCRVLFHDTHHRSVTSPEQMQRYDLSDYDGVLAFGRVIRDLYLDRGWAGRAWVFHEAADVRVFRPLPELEKASHLVWVGNWGDEERTAELSEFLLRPVRQLRVSADAYGVRYPAGAVEVLSRAGIRYNGWLANFDVPRAFARHRVTVHIPRRPYAESLPGIPTIRPFEAMACGIPLICAPWSDSEQLFTSGKDYLVAADGRQMAAMLRDVLNDRRLAEQLADHGRETILQRHTCRHRADELMDICRELELETLAPAHRPEMVPMQTEEQRV